MYSCRVEAKDRVFGASIEDLFVKQHLHRQVLDDGTTDISSEERFCEIETETGPIFKSVLDEIRTLNQGPRLSTAERDALIQCVASLITRDPYLFGKFADDRDFENHVRKTVISYARSDAEREFNLRPEQIKRRMHNARAAALPSRPDLTVSKLQEYGLVFYRLKERMPPLIVGNQMWVFGTESPLQHSFLPVAHDVVMGFYGEPSMIKCVPVSNWFWVQTVNTAIARQCFQIAGRNEADIRSLGKHLTDTPRWLQSATPRSKTNQRSNDAALIEPAS